MSKLKSNIKKAKIEYLKTSKDEMWKQEANKLLPWIYGKGADIGCGNRSVTKDIIRVDVDPNREPDICCSGEKLPFKDGELDYITSIHSFEHFSDQYKVLKEWLRCIKSGGIIGIVHPDVQYTGKQKRKGDNPSLLEDPFNYHYHERTLEQAKQTFEKWRDLNFRIIDSGEACRQWSFYLIIEKN